tara:strand:- start:534 stop:1235 length:702 start_codon:yes stop_codon:yes gene_type:complete
MITKETLTRIKFSILDSEIYDLARHILILFNKIKKKFYKKKNTIEVIEYWKNPNDGNNSPLIYTGEGYITSDRDNLRTDNLIKIIKSFGFENPSILEVGCNVGRNLNGLRKSGFKNLNAIEINSNAIDIMKKKFPETYEVSKITIGSAKDVLKKFQDNEFDIVFTMAVLQHIPDENIKIVTKQISRIANKNLISSEAETYSSWRHFPRSYKKIYKNLNLKYLYRKNGARVFSK